MTNATDKPMVVFYPKAVWLKAREYGLCARFTDAELERAENGGVIRVGYVAGTGVAEVAMCIDNKFPDLKVGGKGFKKK